MAVGDLWVAGNSPDAIYRSDDDGATWGTAIAGPSGQFFLTGIAFDSDGDLWVSGTIPDTIYRSSDDGATWSAPIAGPSGQTELRDIAFAPNGDLWVSGSNPDAIYRSDDDGATWGTAIAGPAGQTLLTGIVFAPNGDLWVAGISPNAVYRSQDDGATWGTATTGPSGQIQLTGIAFAPNGDLLVSGDSPDGLYRSSDDGATWGAVITVPSGQTSVRGIAFVPGTAPSWTDDTGDAISGTVGTAIAPVTVPEADGAPEPTYAASGLPGGLSFDATSRVLSGTPTAAGSGTITVTATNSAGTADWTVAYAFVAGTPTDQTVTAEGRHDTRSAVTVSEEAPPLVLADSDDTGLDVDCKALLVASDDATVGNFFYEDTDRGGTDEPLDGELGLGADESIISGVRRRTATVLQLNDDDNPVTFDIGAYFDTGGAGNDLTAYLQTLADGEVSFPAAAAFARANQVRFTLPADAQTLLDNLEDGDRWIFKLARPAAVTPTDQTVEAEGRHGTRAAVTVTEEVPPPTPATDQAVTAEGRHETRGKTTITEDAPSAATDQPVTAEGRHGTRGEATVSQVAATPATDQLITAEGRHGTRGEATVEDLLPVAGPLRDLRVSVGGRDYSDHVERGDWRIIRRTGVRSEARFRIIARPGEIVIPRNGEEVIATATLGGIVTLFGGYLDEPEIDTYTGGRGLYELNLQSIGFRARLDDTLLTQAQGIDIVQLATAAEQIEALVALLSGEGFTSTVTLPATDNPDPADMRLQHIGPLVDRVSTLNDAIPVVSAAKVVSVVARNLVAGNLRLDASNTELLRVEDSRQNYRTAQVTRGGDLLRIEGFTGRADGRYRLGGVQNLEPAKSLFDDTVALGNGVLWQDGPRARGSRGSSLEAQLIRASDGADLLPSSVVSGSDRSIDSFDLEVLEQPFNANWEPAIALGASGAGGTADLTTFTPPTPDEWRWLLQSGISYGGGVGEGSAYRMRLILSVDGLLQVRFSVPAGFTLPSSSINNALLGLSDLRLAIQQPGRTTFHSRASRSPELRHRLLLIYFDGLSSALSGLQDGDEVRAALWSGYDEATAGLALSGVDLTATALDDLGIAAQASDGTEYAFALADMTGPGGDDTTPYFWPLAVLPFDSVEDMLDEIAKLRSGDSKLVIVDTTAARIDLANRLLLASDTVIEIEATGIHTLDVDGVEEDIGGEGATWYWAQAFQEVQEVPPSSPAPTSVNIRYRARWICRESNGTVPRVERVVIRKDLALPEDGRRFGREQIDAHGEVKETLIADLIIGFGEVVPEGSGVTVDQTLIDRVPQLVGLTPTDVLRVERVEMDAPGGGDLVQQTLRLLRRADESRYRDDWRRALLERVGSD